MKGWTTTRCTKHNCDGWQGDKSWNRFSWIKRREVEGPPPPPNSRLCRLASLKVTHGDWLRSSGFCRVPSISAAFKEQNRRRRSVSFCVLDRSPLKRMIVARSHSLICSFLFCSSSSCTTVRTPPPDSERINTQEQAKNLSQSTAKSPWLLWSSLSIHFWMNGPTAAPLNIPLAFFLYQKTKLFSHLQFIY